MHFFFGFDASFGATVFMKPTRLFALKVQLSDIIFYRKELMHQIQMHSI